MPTDPPQDRRHLSLWQSHPLSVAITVAVLLFLIGALMVADRARPSIANTSGVWGQNTITLQNPTAFTPVYRQPVTPSSPAATDTPLHIFIPPPRPSPTASSMATTSAAASDDLDFNAFVKQITGTKFLASSGPGSAQSDVSGAYAYLPQGLLATTTAKKRTASQDALYHYGNEIGGIIKRFEDSHPNELAVLSAQVKDRSNTQNADALRALGRDLSKISIDMLALSDMPPEALTAHKALAQSYQVIGSKLGLVAQAGSDKEFIDAIQTYDASADEFARNFAALANVFLLSEVSFSKTEGGSVFMFSQTSGIQ